MIKPLLAAVCLGLIMEMSSLVDDWRRSTYLALGQWQWLYSSQPSSALESLSCEWRGRCQVLLFQRRSGRWEPICSAQELEGGRRKRYFRQVQRCRVVGVGLMLGELSQDITLFR